LQPPYRRRGKKLTVLDELRLVKGFDQQRFETLKPYLRVTGTEQINLNTAPVEVLYAWQFSAADKNVGVVLGQDDLPALAAYRRKFPFRQLADLSQVEGFYDRWSTAWLAGSVGVTGSVYQVESQGRINGVTRLASAIVNKRMDKLLSFKVE
jgi:hypothetical protein